ncbi:RHS repeat domain-containing protein [Lysinibacillus sphaericus]|uniref:RHS repeat domain-containing protein n=1 Tax=Lysinibacillus sphaericus TaxID=1421 RepID=UPI00380A1337
MENWNPTSQKIQRPGNRWTAYQHDALGNIIRSDYYDGTWETFSYDKNGALQETENEHVTVKLERDPSGQVIKEWQNNHWIASSYDELGNRSQITSSLGAKIDVARNELGNVLQMTASRSEQAQWTASMQYNELGQEIERILPGDVISKWQYDITGRPAHHRVSSQSRDTRRRAYNFDVNHQLRSMVNELTGVKVTYGYDEFSNLVWANQDSRQFDFLYRSVDDVGNLYETKDKKDRVYGAGSRLLETKDAKFSYDEEGNLVEKVEHNGDTWQYEYYGNGMMANVMKPDNTEVTFKYDALGRRIEKCSEGRATHFVWDGNTILHEYFLQDDSVENASQTDDLDSLVTWVFNDGFVPSAKITNEGNYSIISDYLGTPVEAYDEQGHKVWSAELDVYGRVNEFTGEKDFIPFRYQGQYQNLSSGLDNNKNNDDSSSEEEFGIDFIPFRSQGQYHDLETGLYYNRFRYYDPSIGMYTQQDPIGLAGNNPTLYGYVADPNRFVDPFGLSPLSSIQEQVNSILMEHLPAIQAIDPNATIGYRGSVASGISKAHDSALARPFNPSSFDVDGFIQSDFLANDPIFTNRRRVAGKIPGMSEIEASIDSKLREALPGLRDESFGFRIFKSHELSALAREGDVQVHLGCH